MEVVADTQIQSTLGHGLKINFYKLLLWMEFELAWIRSSRRTRSTARNSLKNVSRDAYREQMFFTLALKPSR